MPHFDDDPRSYPLRVLENGQHSRLPTDDLRSDTASSGRSSPVEAAPSTGALLTEKMLGTRLSGWVKGPRPPRPYIIVPVGGSTQVLCLKNLKIWLPQRRQRELAAVAFFAVWLLSFVLVIHNGTSADGDRTRLSCISRFWYGPFAVYD
jgi:hypothetical protein